MTDLLTRLRAWSHGRLLLDRSGADVAAVLERVIAVYSSHPTAPLSLLCRLPALTAAEVRALDDRREWLRIPAMRGSIFAVPTAVAERVLGATAIPLEKLGPRFKWAGFDRAGYEEVKPRLLAAMPTPKLPEALKVAVPISGKLMVLVRILAFEGLMLRVSESLRTDRLSYVATEARLGRRLEPAPSEASLAWLAGRYLDGFGPARLEDFAWWAGIPKGKAKRALASVETVDVGDGLLLPVGLQRAFEEVVPLTGDEIDVLPKWDPLTMGWAGDGRARFVDPEHGRAILNHMGDGLPLLLRGGRAVATWSRRFSGDRLRVEVTPLPGESVEVGEFEPRLSDVGTLLGAASTKVVLSGAA